MAACLEDVQRRAAYPFVDEACLRGRGQDVAVADRHQGRQTHYSAQLGALAPLADWTSQMTSFWESRFDNLEDLLKRMDQ